MRKVKEKDMTISKIPFNLILKDAMTPESLTCPEQDDLIAFSADELPYERKCQIIEHLLICKECARENVFLESIMQEPVVFPETDVLIPDAVTEALEKELSQ